MTPELMKARIKLANMVGEWTIEHNLELRDVIQLLEKELHNHKLASGGATQWHPPILEE